MRLILTSLLLAVSSPRSPAQLLPAPSPERAVSNFYRSYAALKVTGLPTAAAAAKMGPLLSAPLQRLIKEARVKRARCEKAHPGDKPPWVEGDMFSSNFEGFTGYKVHGASSPDGPRVAVNVRFEYSEKGQPKPATWTDEVSLVKQGGRWVIDNITYGMEGGLGNGFGPSLLGALRGSGCS